MNFVFGDRNYLLTFSTEFPILLLSLISLAIRIYLSKFYASVSTLWRNFR